MTYRPDPAGPAIRSESCTVTFTQIGAVGGAPVIGTFEVVTLQIAAVRGRLVDIDPFDSRLALEFEHKHGAA